VNESIEHARRVFETGTEEEKKQYEEALSALQVTKEEFLNPDLYKKRINEEKKKNMKEDL